MLRILKDCILQGESVHKGECFSPIDFDEADIQVIVGAGYAEFCDDVAEEEDDAIPEDPEDFAVEPVKPVKKTTAKKKAAKKTAK